MPQNIAVEAFWPAISTLKSIKLFEISFPYAWMRFQYHFRWQGHFYDQQMG
jgi:hypothetical protein